MKEPLPAIWWHQWPLKAKIQMYVKENLNLRSLRKPSPTRTSRLSFFILLLISPAQCSRSLGPLCSLVQGSHFCALLSSPDLFSYILTTVWG